MDVKSLTGVEIKDAAKGEVKAVFSTLDVVDSDSDVTAFDAFDEGAPVVISAYGHTSWQGMLPVGKGAIRVAGKEAVLDGQFFMNTTHGRDAFHTVEELGNLQQWSYGYDAVKYSYGERDGKRVRFLEKLKVHEVSPVLIGAGVGTRTLSAKSARTFVDEAQVVLADLTALVDRTADVMAKRAEKNKGLGESSSALLAQVQAQLKRLEDLLRTPQPDEDALAREFLRFSALSSSLAMEAAA